jgi:DNA-binding transcriptional ArsR family regulator
MPHPSEHHAAGLPLGLEEAEALAEAMRAFGTSSRLRLLWAMFERERTVEELSAMTGLEHSATSHQLRLLRQARLVAVRRSGRHAHYRLHDHHVAELLTAIRNHYEHVYPPDPVPLPDRAIATGGKA